MLLLGVIYLLSIGFLDFRHLMGVRDVSSGHPIHLAWQNGKMPESFLTIKCLKAAFLGLCDVR